VYCLTGQVVVEGVMVAVVADVEGRDDEEYVAARRRPVVDRPISGSGRESGRRSESIDLGWAMFQGWPVLLVAVLGTLELISTCTVELDMYLSLHMEVLER